MIMVDTTIVNVALPSMQRELGIRPDNLEWVVNAYILVVAALLLTAGTLGDRFGRRRILLIGLAVFTAASAACALAPDDPHLVAFRAIEGVGAALMAPATLSILVDAYPADDAPRAIGVWAAVAGLGFGLGPIVGGILVERLDWSAVFWVNVPAGILAAFLVLRGVRESYGSRTRSTDLPGTILVTAGLFLLVLGVIETNTHAWLSAVPLTLLGASALILAAFVVREARAREPMLPLSLFRLPGFSPAIGATALSYVGLAATLYYVALYFQDIKDWSPLEAGLSLIPLNLPFFLVAPKSGPLARRFGAGLVVMTGSLISAVAIGGIALNGASASYSDFWPWYLLLGFGFGLASPSMAAAAMHAVDAGHAGAAAGAVNAARQLGSSVGLAVLGSIGVGVALAAWEGDFDDLPGSDRPAAEGLGQSVAGGRAQLVAQTFGPTGGRLAARAFSEGMQAALWVAAASLLGAATLVGIGVLRGARRVHADPA
jgi:MFS transporter, DHA2 family, methylenomycin A resistance protein